ncbi:hypothetical protein [Pseudomonas chlororaphis]|uniref:Uncharacterized protein n=1 Tax=Pseudomonas chlororaphis TaxID=587753 RepID=A0AAX3G4L8_9PSED|nr:hypothetical protein [Pseudomonas chlororaphis]AZC37106.1 hypothetical protein C4K37_2719 [Pseudomonas chlororaphis subsp. piscium]AZC43652.1 hypothetical protein C4K36_2727 [Pseudomonas chlororaphis subsp. piscium]WDG74378.1 hypothetical protein PUP65_08460 [Pseudomonas chlororaphis]WDG75516.1 hypothetical protein PUP65_14425 [Pseudomonas chlororaphis]WDH26848.1 hypothetical protein PUP81_19885 [Pseudomonas chlororaphis]
MSEKDPLPPINGAHRSVVEKMVDHGLTGFADHIRMLSFWRRLLAGDNDPEEIAQGLAMALRSGRYIPNPGPGRSMAVTINISGNPDAQALADALRGALGER